MAIELEKLVARIEADSSQLRAELRSVEKRTRATSGKMSRSFGRVNKATAGLKKQLVSVKGALLALGATAIFRKMTKETFGFETSMSRIVGLVGLSKEEVQGLAKGVKDLAPTVGKGPLELADALFFITSAGARGADALSILEASARASAGGLGETKTVADAVTSAINAYGKESLSASQATDILTAAVREGKLEAAALAPVFGKVLALAETVGVSFDQLAASLAAMSRLGIDAAEGATAVKGIFTVLVRAPTKEQTKQFKDLGLSISEFRRVIREEGLLEGLLLLKEKIGDNKDALSKLFPEVRGLIGVLTLVGKNAGIARKIFDGVLNSLGDGNKAFAAAADTLEHRWNVQVVKMNIELEKLGEKTLPGLLEGFIKLTGALREGAKGWQAIGTMAAMIAGIFTDNLTLIDKIVLKQGQLADLQERLNRVQAGKQSFLDRLFGANEQELTTRINTIKRELKDLEALWIQFNISTDKASKPRRIYGQRILPSGIPKPFTPTKDQIQQGKLYQETLNDLSKEMFTTGEISQVLALRWDVMHGELSKLDDTQKKSIMTILAWAEATQKQAEAAKKAKEEQQDLEKAAKSMIQQVIDSVEPTNALTRQIRQLQEMEEKLRKTNPGLADSLLDIEFILQDKLQKALEETNDEMKELEKVAGELSTAIGTAFEDAIIEGKNFKDVLTALGQDIQRILTRILITKPLESFLTSQVKNTFGGGGFADLFGGLFGAAATAAPAAAAATVAIPDPVIYAAAHGGARPPGPLLVGERGPEIITPRVPVSVTPAAQTAQMMAQPSVTVQMTINTPDAGSFRASNSLIVSDLETALAASRRRDL